MTIVSLPMIQVRQLSDSLVKECVLSTGKLLTTGFKAWSHRRTDMYRKENGLKYAGFGYPVTKFISSAAQSSRDRYVEPGS